MAGAVAPASNTAPPSHESAAQSTQISSESILQLLQECGPMSAPALARMLCVNGGGESGAGGVAWTPRQLQLQLKRTLLDMVSDFELMRQGKGSLQPDIDLQDRLTTFHVM